MRRFPVSVTYTFLSITATPVGPLSCPSYSPLVPNFSINEPSTLNFCTRSLPESTTYRLSFSSKHTPSGPRNCPSALPGFPKLDLTRQDVSSRYTHPALKSLTASVFPLLAMPNSMLFIDGANVVTPFPLGSILLIFPEENEVIYTFFSASIAMSTGSGNRKRFIAAEIIWSESTKSERSAETSPLAALNLRVSILLRMYTLSGLSSASVSHSESASLTKPEYLYERARYSLAVW